MLELGAKLLRVAKNFKKGVPCRTKLVMAVVQVAGRRWQVAGRDGSSYTRCHSEEHGDEESASSRYSVLGTGDWVLISLCKHLPIDTPTHT